MAETDFLGFGLTRPFRRDGARDFQSAGGEQLVGATIGQVLGTRAASPVAQGELPWRPDAGSKLYLVRHRNNTPASREAARVYAQEAIRRWEPRVEVLDVTPLEPERITELNQMVLKVTWRLIEKNRQGNQVSLPQTTEVTV